MSGIRRRLGGAIFLRVAGPDGPRNRDRIHGAPGPRWFAADSAITRVHGDASMFVGGLRAVVLQTLHPAAMTAVAEHSGYRGDLWGRLARTSTFLAETTFGRADDAQRAVDVVRAVHARIGGTLADGTTYAASDPHLLAWVHAAEADSFLLAHQVLGARPLDEEGCEEYLTQAGTVARRLGVPDPPTTRAALAVTLDAFRPELRATPQAVEAVAFLRSDPGLPAVALPGYRALVAGAVGLLPRWARSELGLPTRFWTEPAGRLVGRAATGTIRWATTDNRRAARSLRDTRERPATPSGAPWGRPGNAQPNGPAC